MRTLIILRGPRHSGKTRFVLDNDLRAWHVDQSNLERPHLAPEMTEDGEYRPGPQGMHKAYACFMQVLQTKFENSEFVLCEMADKGFPAGAHSTNITDKTIHDICDVAKTYRYQIFVVDFLCNQSGAGEFPYILTDSASYYQKRPWRNASQRVTPDEMQSKLPGLRNPVTDLSHLDAIVAIGDVHASHTPLSKCLSFAKGRDNIAVVFTGDFISKGTSPVETLRLLDEFANENDNVFFLSGNHEIGLEGWAFKRHPLRQGFQKYTLPILKKAGYRRQEARNFLRRLQDHHRFHWRGYDILVTHGGLSAPTDIPGLLPGSLKRMGVGPSSLDIDRVWERNSKSSRQLQIHGHRNFQRLKIEQCQTSFNIEGIDSYSCVHGMVLKSSDRGIEAKGFSLPATIPSS